MRFNGVKTAEHNAKEKLLAVSKIMFQRFL
jgi:hypothetical protein